MAIDTQRCERGDSVVPLLVGVFVAAAGVCFFGVTADSTADARRQQGLLGGPGAKTGRLCGKSS